MKKTKKYVRPSWDDYFMDLVHAVSARGTCDRGRCGAVAIKNKQVLATGYVGSPVGMPHCDDVGHELKKVTHADGHTSEHCMRTVHAEQNLICQSAKNGVSMDGATVYTLMTPCRTCAMLLINSGVKKVVCEKKYHAGKECELMFKKAKVKLEFVTKELMKY